MPPLRGEGLTCLVLRCTHSRYENEMTPQLDSRPRLLTTLAPIAALFGLRLIEKAAQPARPFSDCILRLKTKKQEYLDTY